MEDENIDGAGGAEDIGTTGTPGSGQNETALEGSETGAGASSPPSSGEPPADAPASMEDAIRSGLASLNKQGDQAQGGKEKPVVPGKPGEGDPGLKGKPGGKPEQKDDLHRMPEGLSEQAQQRFSRLVNENKDLSKRFEQVNSQAAQLQDMVAGFREVMTESQMTAPELDRFAGYIKAIKTGNFEAAEQALISQVRLFEQMTGRSLNVGDPFAEFPDIKQALDAMQITEEHAREIAASRRLRQGMQQGTQRQQEQQGALRAEQENQRAWEGARDKALDDIKAFSSEMATKDIDWKAKEGILIEKVESIVSLHPTRPDLWFRLIKEHYDTMDRASKATGGGQRRTGGPQPLDSGGKGGASRATGTPGNMLDAIKSGLGYQA